MRLTEIALLALCLGVAALLLQSIDWAVFAGVPS